MAGPGSVVRVSEALRPYRKLGNIIFPFERSFLQGELAHLSSRTTILSLFSHFPFFFHFIIFLPLPL